MTPPANGDVPGQLARRARVAACAVEAIHVVWLESACRGCVGCGGRCNLFAAPEGSMERLPVTDARIVEGETVEVLVDPRALRRAAFRSYGVALACLLVGAGLGHFAGETGGFPNAGTLAGLLAGTFLAGRLTKRFDAAPDLRVRPCLDTPSRT